MEVQLFRWDVPLDELTGRLRAVVAGDRNVTTEEELAKQGMARSLATVDGNSWGAYGPGTVLEQLVAEGWNTTDFATVAVGFGEHFFENFELHLEFGLCGSKSDSCRVCWI